MTNLKVKRGIGEFLKSWFFLKYEDGYGQTDLQN